MVYGIIEGEELKLGACDIEWNKELTEPRPLFRGDVARIWLYMADKHGVKISEQERAMFLRWSQQDQPTSWEILRNKRIKKHQGNGNPYIEMFTN